MFLCTIPATWLCRSIYSFPVSISRPDGLFLESLWSPIRASLAFTADFHQIRLIQKVSESTYDGVLCWLSPDTCQHLFHSCCGNGSMGSVRLHSSASSQGYSDYLFCYVIVDRCTDGIVVLVRP